MAAVTIDLDLPPGVTVTTYERHADSHAFEVAWPLPERCVCDACGREDRAHLEFRDRVQVVRDLDLWGQPSFWVYQPPFYRCPWCHHRQAVLPPFKRRDTSYTYRFEQHVLRLLIGSTEEDVARRLGIAAETVGFIVRHQLTEAKAKQVHPQRVITDVGIDELSLKKRHQLYVTILTDLTDPEQPEVLSIAAGRDEAAAQACLAKLSETQRRQVATYRADMAPAFHAACQAALPNAQAVIDRFHVAKKFNEVIDGQRKKNHPGVQGETVEGGAQDVSVPDVAVPPGPQGSHRSGAGGTGGLIPPGAATAPPAPAQGAVQTNLRPVHQPAER
jgi:transposase